MNNNCDQLHKLADVDGTSDQGEVLTLAVVVKLPKTEIDALLTLIRNHDHTRIIHFQSSRGNLWITK